MLAIYIGITIILCIIFIALAIQNHKNQNNKHQTKAVQESVSFRQLMQEISWSQIEQEMIRLKLDEKRELSLVKLAYETLLSHEPSKTQERNFSLYLHINEDRGFIDVCSKEEGDLYTEYMIEYEDWKNILAYTVSANSLQQYDKTTLVSAILYSMTTNGFSQNELNQSFQVHTG